MMEVVAYSGQADDVHRLVQEFHQVSLSEYGLAFNNEALTKTINDIVAQGEAGGYTCCFMAVVDGRPEGLIAGKEVFAPYSNDRIWHEVVWYMSSEHRIHGMKLIRAAREKLKDEGFNAMVMVHMHNSKTEQLGRLYERLGFQPMETNYIGRL
jgi:GNAT superfamily N-acetyltransferase